MLAVVPLKPVKGECPITSEAMSNDKGKASEYQ